jgi:uncharacterized delta-60 repeat protein
MSVALLMALLVGAGFTPVHAQSPLDGFNPGASNSVNAVVVQPDGKILVGGDFTTLGGGGTGTTPRNGIGRLHPDGSLDTTFNPGANGSVFAVALQPDGKILVAGNFTMLGGGGTGTTTRNRIGRLHPDGSLDASFNPGANDDVWALALQPDGKVLVGGDFTTLGGSGTGTTTRNRIGRLHADGTLDATFNPGANNIVFALALEPDGQILAGGWFTTLGGGGTGATTRNFIGRLHSDGSVDVGFNPGASNIVYAVAVEPDGRILVGGAFTALGGGATGTTVRNRIGRLLSDGTLDATFNPGASDIVSTLSVQPDGRILVGGIFSTLGDGGFGTSRNQIGRLHPDGSVDTTFNPGANQGVYVMAVQSDGMILVGGAFTSLGGGGTGMTVRFRIGRLHGEGSLDTTFNPGANNSVYALAVQPDGSILVGGSFTGLGAGTGTTVRNRIGRLRPNGTVDASFNPGADGDIRVMAIQPDAGILVGGLFTTLGGTTVRNRIGRLHPDGALDTTFNPGANGNVNALALQANGQILVGGAFTMLGGGGTGTTAREGIGRLNPTGSLDATFNPGANGAVTAFAVQPDGKILVAGGFTMLGGGGTGTTVRNRIGRLNANGSLDAAFNPGANNVVLAVALQPDGKIVVGGLFTTLGGGGTGTTMRSRIGRLNPDGSLDTTFNPGANFDVYALAVQPDGKILVGGGFTMLGGGGTGTTTRNFIARLHPDGSLDTTFNPGSTSFVLALAVQPDGKILLGGQFAGLGGGTGTTARANIGRLSTTDAAIQRLSVTCAGCAPALSGAVQTQVTWARSGAGIEVERVTVDVSSDGVTYGPVTTATRVSGGWQAPQEVASNANRLIRARGYYATGVRSGSIIESIRQVYIACPAIATTALPAGTQGVAYATTITAPGAIGVVSFSTASALPSGLTLSAAGVVAGTPTQTGTFSFTVTAIDSTSGCAGSRPYTLTINPVTTPAMSLDKTSLHFAGVWSNLLGLPVLVSTGAQAVRLTQSGPGTVTWTATPNQPWLTVTPSSGTGSATLSVAVSDQMVSLVNGPYTAAITLTFTGTASVTGPIDVTMTVPLRPLVTLGVIDTPLENSAGVTGAVPFTGWALDSIEVVAVSICRAAVAGEAAPNDGRCDGAAQIYVGNAVFIDGARPDVLAAFPTYPRSSRAGWGFMVLTNMLPNQGNGTYTFHAYALPGRSMRSTSGDCPA